MKCKRATSRTPLRSLAGLCSLLLLVLLAAAATVPHPAVAGLVTPCAVNAKLGAKLNATTGLLQGKRKLAQFSGESLLACLGGEAVRK